MDDIKIYVKNENEQKTLIQMIRIYSQDIRMESEIEDDVYYEKRERRINWRNRTALPWKHHNT